MTRFVATSRRRRPCRSPWFTSRGVGGWRGRKTGSSSCIPPTKPESRPTRQRGSHREHPVQRRSLRRRTGCSALSALPVHSADPKVSSESEYPTLSTRWTTRNRSLTPTGALRPTGLESSTFLVLSQCRPFSPRSGKSGLSSHSPMLLQLDDAYKPAFVSTVSPPHPSPHRSVTVTCHRSQLHQLSKGTNATEAKYPKINARTAF